MPPYLDDDIIICFLAFTIYTIQRGVYLLQQPIMAAFGLVRDNT